MSADLAGLSNLGEDDLLCRDSEEPLSLHTKGASPSPYKSLGSSLNVSAILEQLKRFEEIEKEVKDLRQLVSE